mgnify:CR=1 FL=1
MKKSTLINLALLVGFAVIISGCCSVKKMQKGFPNVKYTMTPEILEMHADTVAISISGKIPEKCFCPKAVVEFTPVIKYEGGEKLLTLVTYQG